MHVIYSTQDPAGVNIYNNLKKILEKEQTSNKPEITKTDLPLLYSDEIVNKIETDFLVFASKHKSESKKPSFTVHVPGNWNKAEMGGKDKQISFSDPIKMKALITALDKKIKKMNIEIPVVMEVDHHGPLCSNPCAFIEIGSSEEQWNNVEYGRIVGETIMEFEDGIDEIEVKTVAVGVGGGHYCPAFNKPEIEGNVAFAHIIPNYAAGAIEYETFVQSIERSTEEVEKVLIDWKGLKQQERQKIIHFTEEYGIDYVRV